MQMVCRNRGPFKAAPRAEFGSEGRKEPGLGLILGELCTFHGQKVSVLVSGNCSCSSPHLVPHSPSFMLGGVWGPNLAQPSSLWRCWPRWVWSFGKDLTLLTWVSMRYSPSAWGTSSLVGIPPSPAQMGAPEAALSGSWPCCSAPHVLEGLRKWNHLESGFMEPCCPRASLVGHCQERLVGKVVVQGLTQHIHPAGSAPPGPKIPPEIPPRTSRFGCSAPISHLDSAEGTKIHDSKGLEAVEAMAGGQRTKCFEGSLSKPDTEMEIQWMGWGPGEVGCPNCWSDPPDGSPKSCRTQGWCLLWHPKPCLGSPGTLLLQDAVVPGASMS